jgi:hypothetical protein
MDKQVETTIALFLCNQIVGVWKIAIPQMKGDGITIPEIGTGQSHTYNGDLQ